MRKRIVAIFLLEVMCLIGTANVMAEDATEVMTEVAETETEKENDYDFRNTKWGMSKKEVKEIEGEPLYEGDNGILYEGEAAGKSCEIMYTFENDKLISGLYSFNEEHVNKNLYYDDYVELVDVYSEVYGEPDKQVEDWSDDLYKDDPTEIGMAISIGHVSFATGWLTEDSMIILGVNGDNFEVSLIASYEDLDYEQKTNTDGI